MISLYHDDKYDGLVIKIPSDFIKIYKLQNLIKTIERTLIRCNGKDEHLIDVIKTLQELEGWEHKSKLLKKTRKKKNQVVALDYFDELMIFCKELFLSKMEDYGPTWTILRWESMLDQIWIKAKRIRTLEERDSLVGECQEDEYIGIINYSIITLIKIWFSGDLQSQDSVLDSGKVNSIDGAIIGGVFDRAQSKIRELMERKNHDYGEAWRDMNIKSITDQILIKLLRIKTILENDGELLVSEGIDAQFSDVVNYSVFGLIQMNYKIKN